MIQQLVEFMDWCCNVSPYLLPQLHGFKLVGADEKIQLLASMPIGLTEEFQLHGACSMHATEHLHEFFSRFHALIS